MFKTLTAAALAATLGLTGTTTTAVAASDADRLASLLFGAAALAIIAKTVDDRNNRQRAHTSRSYVAPVITPQFNRNRPQRHRARAVPKSCERVFNTAEGTRRVFGVPCLNRSGYSARLPQQCLRAVQLPRGTVQAYGKRCLLNSGVRVEG